MLRTKLLFYNLEEFKKRLLDRIGISLSCKKSHTSRFGNDDIGGSDSKFSLDNDSVASDQDNSRKSISFTPNSILKPFSTIHLSTPPPPPPRQLFDQYSEDEMGTQVEWDIIDSLPEPHCDDHEDSTRSIFGGQVKLETGAILRSAKIMFINSKQNRKKDAVELKFDLISDVSKS